MAVAPSLGQHCTTGGTWGSVCNATYSIFPPQVPPLPPGLRVPLRLLFFRRAFSLATSLEAVEVQGTWRFPQV